MGRDPQELHGAVSGDPIPWKSSKLFVPQIDMWGPKAHGGGNSEPPNAMDYTDAMALMRAHRATYQSAMYQISPSIVPADASKHPINVSGHAVFSEVFPMVVLLASNCVLPGKRS